MYYAIDLEAIYKILVLFSDVKYNSPYNLLLAQFHKVWFQNAKRFSYQIFSFGAMSFKTILN